MKRRVNGALVNEFLSVCIPTSFLWDKDPGESLCSPPFCLCPLPKQNNYNISPCNKRWCKNWMKSYSTSAWQLGTPREVGLHDPPLCAAGCCWALLPLCSGCALGSQMEGCYCPQRGTCSHCHYTAGSEISPPLNSPSPHWAPPASGWTWGAHTQTHFSLFSFSFLIIFAQSIWKKVL